MSTQPQTLSTAQQVPASLTELRDLIFGLIDEMPEADSEDLSAEFRFRYKHLAEEKWNKRIDENTLWLENQIKRALAKSAALASVATPTTQVSSVLESKSVEAVAEPVAEPAVEKDNHFLQIARGCLDRGEFRVLPIAKTGKNPLVKWIDTPFNTTNAAEWLKLAESHIQEMGRRFPDANACIVAKPDEFLFLDIDTMNEFHAAYEEFAGEPYSRVYTTSARKNRCQEHFQQTDATRALGNIGQFQIDGIDFSVRQNNLYVLAEDSVHPSGSVYERIVDAAIRPMPDKLVAFIKHLCEKAGKKSEVFASSVENPLLPFNEATDEKLDLIAASFIKQKAPNSVEPGGHDVFLTALAGALRNAGADLEQIEAILIRDCEEVCLGHGSDFADMCHNKAKSVSRYAVGHDYSCPIGGKKPGENVVPSAQPKPKQGAETGDTPEEFDVIRADKVKTKRVKWLWEGYFAEKMNTINGDPGEGKGVLTCYLAARVSRGEDFFNAKNTLPPSEVLMLSNEDDPEDTLVPRLEAAGSDLTKIHIVKMVSCRRGATMIEREFALDKDIERLRSWVSVHPGIKLVVIDPVSNYLGASVKTIDEKSVRMALMPLVHLADELKTTIIGVQHLNKKSDQKSIYRVSGAMGFIGVGRMNWICAKVPPAKDGALNDDYEMQKVKGNIVKRNQTGLIYRIEDAIVVIEGQNTVVPYLKFVGTAEKTLDQQQPGGGEKSSPSRSLYTRTAECEDTIVEMLTPGPMPCDSVVHLMDVDHNFSKATVYRAVKNLKILKFAGDEKYAGENGKQYNVRMWRLPDRPEGGSLNQGEELPF